MDTSTGKIYSEEEAKKLDSIRQKFLVGLDSQQYKSLSGMYRKQRREY